MKRETPDRIRRTGRWLRAVSRWALPAALLLQLPNCSATNTELLIYQYEVGLRNLIVNLLGAVLSSVI